MKKYVFTICCLWMLTLAASAQVNNYYVAPAPTGNDSRTAVQAQDPGMPWATINHAILTAVLGTSGTTIHVADGTYLEFSSACPGNSSTICLNRGGTSTQPLVLQCDNGLNGAASAGHCKIRETANRGDSAIMWMNGVSYTTFQGFDMGGDSTHPATLVQAGLIIYAKDTNGHDLSVNQNYIHDISSAANDGNGFGNGCPSEGMIVVDANNTGGAVPKNNKFIGNFLNNGGTLASPSCNQYHGMYLQGAQQTVENNIVGNVPGSGLKIYPEVCSEVVSNNLVFHAGWWGILVANSTAGCGATGVAIGNSTINNNMLINNGFNHACGAIAEGAGSGTNKYGNNLLLGNAPNDNVVQNCSTSTSVSGVSGTINGGSGATLANTFINYQNNGSGDYHLKAGSLAIGSGITSCVSGGMSPCAPTVSLSGIVRPQPPSIGFDELAGATLAPDSPTNLTAVVK